jgi:hypothetical protein
LLEITSKEANTCLLHDTLRLNREFQATNENSTKYN